MSTNYGRTDEAGNNLSRSNTGSNNQVGFLITNVPAGVISYLDVYAEGVGAGARMVLCLWDASGNLLAQTAQFTTGVGSSALHGQSWQRAALTTPYRANATASYHVGFWRNAADQVAYSYLSSGGTVHPDILGSQANVGSPGTLATGTSSTAQLSAYLEWDPGNAYGSSAGGTPTALQGIYGSHLAGTPTLLLGVYRGPSPSGGTPIKIW